jgi:uncharacterized protein YecT (DUF1311 family)
MYLTSRWPAVLPTALAGWLSLGVQPQAGAIPPPPDQFLAQCESPAYASDVVVCGDDELMDLDRRLRRLYEPLQQSLEPGATGTLLDAAALVEPQDAWFRRRSLCAFSPRHADCLRAAYAERLQVLGAARMYLRQPPVEVLRGVCRSAPWGLIDVLISATQRGEILLASGHGRLLAIAVGEVPRDDWTPYLRHEAEGSQLHLFPVEGPVITCELRQPDRAPPGVSPRP